jgi:two-component system response regulator
MLKIVLVEDNPDEVELTLLAFKKSSIANDVIVKRDGQAALDFFFREGGVDEKEQTGQVALILLDLNLPRVSGLQVLEKLRADTRTSLIPIIILTSSKEQSDLLSSYNLGCNSYICKPIDFKQFVDIVKQLGHYWLVLNEQAPPKRK